jgi:hypothetical protein
MKQVEFYFFTLPPDAWNKKPRRSGWKMSLEEAAKRHPGAVPELLTKEVRNLPETPEEVQAKQMIGAPWAGIAPTI